ncbi:hypothetical protein BS47DRAFT_1357312 [Hydnum rufescens UP504]|uniref:Uncharacterized protein n=1 Tax=Hydnum rufescens UP504 TaxID=1448309 RepID=A0A9P6BAT5_9AGAM|nr:hypothetical protein BS47DRAFT_1357312 [Hydnum rufescens UP504]
MSTPSRSPPVSTIQCDCLYAATAQWAGATGGHTGDFFFCCGAPPGVRHCTYKRWANLVQAEASNMTHFQGSPGQPVEQSPSVGPVPETPTGMGPRLCQSPQSGGTPGDPERTAKRAAQIRVLAKASHSAAWAIQEQEETASGSKASLPQHPSGANAVNKGKGGVPASSPLPLGTTALEAHIFRQQEHDALDPTGLDRSLLWTKDDIRPLQGSSKRNFSGMKDMPDVFSDTSPHGVHNSVAITALQHRMGELEAVNLKQGELICNLLNRATARRDSH